MNTELYIGEIAKRLSPANRPKGPAAVFVARLHELAKGTSVSKKMLAQRLDWLDTLAHLSARMPRWTGVLMVILGLWSVWFGLFVSLK